MNIIKEFERNGLEFTVAWDYEEYTEWQDIAPDLSITTERVDGSSVKLNRRGYEPCNMYYSYWATPTEHREYFEQDVKLLRDFFDDKLSMIYFQVSAFKAGIKLADSYISGCTTYNCYNDEKLLEEFGDYIEDLVSEAEQEAAKTLQALCV